VTFEVAVAWAVAIRPPGTTFPGPAPALPDRPKTENCGVIESTPLCSSSVWGASSPLCVATTLFRERQKCTREFVKFWSRIGFLKLRTLCN
jgi:hypothetical protein